MSFGGPKNLMDPKNHQGSIKRHEVLRGENFENPYKPYVLYVMGPWDFERGKSWFGSVKWHELFGAHQSTWGGEKWAKFGCVHQKTWVQNFFKLDVRHWTINLKKWAYEMHQ